MAPKLKGYKISIQELMQQTGGTEDMIESTYSSGLTDSKTESDWSRGQRRNFQNDSNRKPQKNFGMSRTGFGEMTMDDESPWRRSGPVAEYSEGQQQTGFSQKERRFNKLGEGTGDFDRRGKGGNNLSSSKRSNTYQFSTSLEDVDFSTVRSGGGVPQSAQPWSNEGQRGGFFQSSRKCEPTFQRQTEGSVSDVKVPDGTGSYFKEHKERKAEVTWLERETKAKNTSSAAPEPEKQIVSETTKQSTIVESSKSEPVPKAQETSAKAPPVSLNHTQEKEPEQKNVVLSSGNVSENKPVVSPEKTESPPEKDKLNTSATAATPVKLFKPKILQKQENERKLQTNSLKILMEQQKKNEAANNAEPESSVTKSLADNSANPWQSEKKRLRQEKEEKKRLEKEGKKRVEKLRKSKFEQVHQLECQAIQTVQESLDRFQKAEESLYLQLQQRSESQRDCMLESFKILFTSEELQTLVPSLVLAKCIVMASYVFLQTTMDNPEITDLERMNQTRKNVISPFKKIILYLLDSSNIPNHSVQLLRETQLCFAALNFPRISPGLNLIEAVWDGLFMSHCISEKSFHDWHETVDDGYPGRSNVIFQTLSWFEWLRSAPYEGEETRFNVVDDAESENEEDDGYPS